MYRLSGSATADTPTIRSSTDCFNPRVRPDLLEELPGLGKRGERPGDALGCKERVHIWVGLIEHRADIDQCARLDTVAALSN